MTEQDVFNSMWTRFVVNKEPLSQSEQRGCMYRLNLMASDPVRCGIGGVIPDEVYRPAFEDIGIRDLLMNYNYEDLRGVFNSCDPAKLQGLQECHDYAHNQAELECRLTIHALEHGYTVPA